MSVSEIPFHLAVTGPQKDEWRDALYSEIRSLIQNDTFDLVDRPADKKVLKCRTVLRNKYNMDGALDRRKARVVARGFAQCPGVDFFETFAPVARLGSFRLLIAVAAKFDLRISQLDVETAYLNGKIDVETFMETPELLREMLERMIIQEDNAEILKRVRVMLKKIQESDAVCRLNKAIYGLRQSARQWYAELDRVLRGIGLTPTNADSCVYVDTGKLTFVLVYVDDILIVSDNRKRERQIKEALVKSFKIKDLGEAKHCLGFEIRREVDSIHLSQKGYVLELLNRFGMHNCNPVSTPLTSDVKLTKNPNAAEVCKETFPYREAVGELMYAAMGMRPDIAHAVSVLSQFSSCFDKSHCMVIKRVFRYLKGTANYELVYRKDNLLPRGYVDADWGNCIIDRRSYTGYIFILSEGAVTWESRKQRTVALSSTEAVHGDCRCRQGGSIPHQFS